MSTENPTPTTQLRYAVLAAVGLNLVAAILLTWGGVYVGEEIGFVLTVGIYLFVYRWLATNPQSARSYAALFALCDAGFALASYTSNQRNNLVWLDLAGAVCLGFACNRIPATWKA